MIRRANQGDLDFLREHDHHPTPAEISRLNTQPYIARILADAGITI